MTIYIYTWWRHQMETFFALLAICAGNSPVTGEFPAQRPATQSFDVFFDLCLNKRLSKQWWGWWFHYDVTVMLRLMLKQHMHFKSCRAHSIFKMVWLQTGFMTFCEDILHDGKYHLILSNTWLYVFCMCWCPVAMFIIVYAMLIIVICMCPDGRLYGPVVLKRW